MIYLVRLNQALKSTTKFTSDTQSTLYIRSGINLYQIKCVLEPYLVFQVISSDLHKSGRWQAPAAVLPPEGWQRGRGPEGPEDKGHGHSRARRAREWPKLASPRARRARGRAKLSARLGACQCYYMFFTTQLKIAKFMGHSQDLNVGQKS